MERRGVRVRSKGRSSGGFVARDGAGVVADALVLVDDESVLHGKRRVYAPAKILGYESAMAKYDVGLSLTATGLDSRSDFHWRLLGIALVRAYKVVIREAKEGHKRWVALSTKEPRGRPIAGREKVAFVVAINKTNMIRPAAMLAGMAIECYLKAVISLTQAPPDKNHDLLTLARLANFGPLSVSDETLLSELSKMIQLGRYYMTKKGEASFDLSSSRIDAMMDRLERHLESVFS